MLCYWLVIFKRYHVFKQKAAGFLQTSEKDYEENQTVLSKQGLVFGSGSTKPNFSKNISTESDKSFKITSPSSQTELIPKANSQKIRFRKNLKSNSTPDSVNATNLSIENSKCMSTSQSLIDRDKMDRLQPGFSPIKVGSPNIKRQLSFGSNPMMRYRQARRQNSQRRKGQEKEKMLERFRKEQQLQQKGELIKPSAKAATMIKSKLRKTLSVSIVEPSLKSQNSNESGNSLRDRILSHERRQDEARKHEALEGNFSTPCFLQQHQHDYMKAVKDKP